jgi:hypothetical protein
MRATRNWPGLCALLCSTVAAAQSPQTPPAGTPGVPGAPPSGVPPTSAPRQPPPADDELIEFLGSDDVGDAAWWEFLKKSAPGKDPSKPATPPQDAK